MTTAYGMGIRVEQTPILWGRRECCYRLHRVPRACVNTCQVRDGEVCPCRHRAVRRLPLKVAELPQPRHVRCPMCGAEIVSRQYYVGGRGYVYFDVCSGDGSHYSKAAAKEGKV